MVPSQRVLNLIVVWKLDQLGSCQSLNNFQIRYQVFRLHLNPNNRAVRTFVIPHTWLGPTLTSTKETTKAGRRMCCETLVESPSSPICLFEFSPQQNNIPLCFNPQMKLQEIVADDRQGAFRRHRQIRSKDISSYFLTNLAVIVVPPTINITLIRYCTDAELESQNHIRKLGEILKSHCHRRKTIVELVIPNLTLIIKPPA